MNSTSNRYKILAIALIVIDILAAIIIFIAWPKNIGHIVANDHLGTLTYFMPDGNYYHRQDDVGVTTVDEGTFRISAKSYNCYDDMSVVSIWNYCKYTDKDFDECVSELDPDEIVDFSGEQGELPQIVDRIVEAADESEDCGGSYFLAYLKCNGKIYKVTVENGDAPCSMGERFIASLEIDDSLEEEYVKM